MKTFFVASRMAELGEYQKAEVETGETKKTLFGGEKKITKTKQIWVGNGKYSDCIVDGHYTAKMLNEKISELENEGYEIVSISPVESGNWSYKFDGLMNKSQSLFSSRTTYGGGYGYGYGYSYTSGYLILAKKK